MESFNHFILNTVLAVAEIWNRENIIFKIVNEIMFPNISVIQWTKRFLVWMVLLNKIHLILLNIIS